MVSLLIKFGTEYLLQKVMETEQEETLGRTIYERSEEEAKGYRKGYEDRKIKTAEGILEVSVPQIRGLETPWLPVIWENLSQRSKAVDDIIREMWVRGMSVRDVEIAFEKVAGQFFVSKSTVTSITETLYEQYESFRTRDLSNIDAAYLFIDAVHEPLRKYNTSKAVMCC